ncbi:MAG: hypothetical protein BWK80_55855 [Desulfobacteraceae bacterium IS3]|nr:MAG: hypothetical protein BWK80_55855 [Desulfobacteraceae bacterium IS3]
MCHGMTRGLAAGKSYTAGVQDAKNRSALFLHSGFSVKRQNIKQMQIVSPTKRLAKSFYKSASYVFVQKIASLYFCTPEIIFVIFGLDNDNFFS